MARATPRKIGRYALYGALASGGMATVHVGRLRGSAGFQRTVAIKRLHAQLAEDSEFVAMFLDEARLAGRIRHSNVVSVIDVVSAEHEVLLVMEYVQGESLSRLMKGRRVPPPILAAILCDALDGLHAAHEAHDEQGQPLGIVHRDVSPQNIIVGVDGLARVLDFGIAKASNRIQVTREGQLKGKLAYMSPEQLHHKPLTRAADIHAIGIVLWEGLTGERLFAANSEGETVTKVLFGDRDAPSARGAPPEYDGVTLKALAPDPADRFATAREMSIALAKCGTKAEAHEVAEWVSQVAKDALQTRLELISQIESGASTPSLPGQERPDDVPTSVETRSDLSTDAPQARTGWSRNRFAFAGAGAGALVVIGVAIAASVHGGVSSSSSAAQPAASSVASAEPTTTPTETASASSETPNAPASAAREQKSVTATRSAVTSVALARPSSSAAPSASTTPAAVAAPPRPNPSVSLPDHL